LLTLASPAGGGFNADQPAAADVHLDWPKTLHLEREVRCLRHPMSAAKFRDREGIGIIGRAASAKSSRG